MHTAQSVTRTQKKENRDSVMAATITISIWTDIA